MEGARRHASRWAWLAHLARPCAPSTIWLSARVVGSARAVVPAASRTPRGRRPWRPSRSIGGVHCDDRVQEGLLVRGAGRGYCGSAEALSLIHISEPTRLALI
eukprot:14786909-Alexandrium_andersonii.AAC.2